MSSFLRHRLALMGAMVLWATVAGAGSVSYEYDELGRLKKVTYDDQQTIEYALDDAGNRTLVTTSDAPVILSISNASATEGGNISFTVSRSGGSGQTVSVTCATSSGSATSGTDFTAVNTSLSFTSAESSKTCVVPTTQDPGYEGNESLTATLSNPSTGAILGVSSATGTIVEDDAAPSFTIADASVGENAGSVVITVSKSGTAALTHAVNYATSNGTASSGADYTAASGSLSFGPSETTKTFTVTIADDAAYEGNENFTATLSAPTNGATLADGTASITITENEAAPTFAIADASIGESGTSVTLTVTKTGSTALSHAVSYATANNTATAGADYTAASGSLTFASADTSKTFTVSLTGDSAYEGAESLFANLSAPTNGAVLADGSALVTLIDDDAAPAFTVNDPTVAENGSSLTFTVTKSGTTALTHGLSYASADGSATAAADYTGVSSTLSFAPADATKTITVSLLDDSTYEGNEAFTIGLSGATNGATIADSSGQGTLTENEAAPSFAINDPSIAENGGSLTFTVTKSGATALTHAINYATANGTATSGSDYTAASGTLSFNSSDVSKTFTVSLTDDSTYEGNETLTGSLSSATNGATISDASGTGTISENEAAPSFSVNDVSVAENGGSVTFTVTKTGATAFSHNVSYATANGTATAGFFQDYTAASGTLTFGTSETIKTVAITINDDTPPTWENTEAFTLDLSGATNGATIADSSGTCSITESDLTPQFLAIPPGPVTEGGSIVFTVSRQGNSAFTHSVNYASSNGTATAPADYTAVSGTLTFLASESSKTVTVSTINDTASEAATETFNLNLSGATGGATASSSPGIGEIADDDFAPGIPTNFNCSPATVTTINQQVVCTWTASSGSVANYVVDKSAKDDPSFTNPSSSTVTGTTYSNTGPWATIGDYYFRVKACNASGQCSTHSTVDVVTSCRNGNC